MARIFHDEITADPQAPSLGELNEAIRLLEEAQRKCPRRDIEMAIATLEAARDDLMGRKAH